MIRSESGVIYMAMALLTARCMEIGQNLSDATRHAFTCSCCLTILQEASGQALLNAAGAVKYHAPSLLLVVLQPWHCLATCLRNRFARLEQVRAEGTSVGSVTCMYQFSGVLSIA